MDEVLSQNAISPHFMKILKLLNQIQSHIPSIHDPPVEQVMQSIFENLARKQATSSAFSIMELINIITGELVTKLDTSSPLVNRSAQLDCDDWKVCAIEALHGLSGRKLLTEPDVFQLHSKEIIKHLLDHLSDLVDLKSPRAKYWIKCIIEILKV